MSKLSWRPLCLATTAVGLAMTRGRGEAKSLVFVVDDDASVRQAVTSLLQSVDLCVEAFGSAADFLKSGRAANGIAAACLILDVRLPGVSGLDFQAELAKGRLSSANHLHQRTRRACATTRAARRHPLTQRIRPPPRAPRGSSDPALMPYHVDRSKLYVMDRIANSKLLDAERISRAIEFTPLPIPTDAGDEGNEECLLMRAANLIGQLGDPRYLRKANALYTNSKRSA